MSSRGKTVFTPYMDKNAADPGALLKKTKKQKQKQQRLAECARASASPRPSLPNAADATREDILEVAYWRALVPFLRIGVMDGHSLAKQRGAGKGTSRVEEELLRQQRHKLKEDGYCVAERCEAQRTDTLNHVLVDKLALAASVLEYYGWPTTFLAMYDETWELAQQCQDWMDRITNAHAVSGAQVRNRFCMDIVGFNVVDGVGFSAHRDRQPEDWQPKGHASEDPKTTFDHGFARYITCWVALSDAHPGNSCLHYVTGPETPSPFSTENGKPPLRQPPLRFHARSPQTHHDSV